MRRVFVQRQSSYAARIIVFIKQNIHLIRWCGTRGGRVDLQRLNAFGQSIGTGIVPDIPPQDAGFGGDYFFQTESVR